MATRAELVAEARRWVGTPFHHQGRVLGAGVDCVGVLEAVGTVAGITMRAARDYARAPRRGAIEAELERHGLIELADPFAAAPGDVLLFDWHDASGIAHVGIQTDADRFVHAYAPVGAVIESTLTRVFADALEGAYAVPGLD